MYLHLYVACPLLPRSPRTGQATELQQGRGGVLLKVVTEEDVVLGIHLQDKSVGMASGRKVCWRGIETGVYTLVRGLKEARGGGGQNELSGWGGDTQFQA